MKKVTEKMHPEKDWFNKAKTIKTLDELNNFAKELFEETEHDYGTICHAIGAFILAAGFYSSRITGISNNQAGFVMWDFLRKWSFDNNKTGLKIIDYDNLLYPQYEYRFEKTLSKYTWEALQREAKELLETSDYACDEVRTHWKSIVNKNIPFGFTVKD